MLRILGEGFDIRRGDIAHQHGASRVQNALDRTGPISTSRIPRERFESGGHRWVPMNDAKALDASPLNDIDRAPISDMPDENVGDVGQQALAVRARGAQA